MVQKTTSLRELNGFRQVGKIHPQCIFNNRKCFLLKNCIIYPCNRTQKKKKPRNYGELSGAVKNLITNHFVTNPFSLR